MNILVIAHYQSDGSPCASFVHDQVKAYHALGHNVRVIVPIAVGKGGFQESSRFSTLQREFDNIWYLHMRFLSLSNFGKNGFNTKSAIGSLRWHLPLVLNNFQPDIIHAHTLGFDSDIGTWLKKKLGCPLVVTTHGSDITVPYLEGKKDWLKSCCDQTDAVVGVSSKLIHQLKDCGTRTRLQSILNGFAIEHLSATAKTPDTWLQVCNLIPSKHADTTIRAFAMHLEKHPNAHLTIIGHGGERAKLESLCVELGISHAVHFTGALPNRDVLAKMAATQFFVMPSHPEGFGIVYLEAMANGCITIGTEGEGIADLIISGKNGFLVPPDAPNTIAQVIDWCLANQEDSAAITEHGRCDALNLTWAKNAQAYTLLFKELIGK